MTCKLAEQKTACNVVSLRALDYILRFVKRYSLVIDTYLSDIIAAAFSIDIKCTCVSAFVSLVQFAIHSILLICHGTEIASSAIGFYAIDMVNLILGSFRIAENKPVQKDVICFCDKLRNIRITFMIEMKSVLFNRGNHIGIYKKVCPIRQNAVCAAVFYDKVIISHCRSLAFRSISIVSSCGVRPL